jgi:hypothetical protein
MVVHDPLSNEGQLKSTAPGRSERRKRQSGPSRLREAQSDVYHARGGRTAPPQGRVLSCSAGWY